MRTTLKKLYPILAQMADCTTSVLLAENFEVRSCFCHSTIGHTFIGVDTSTGEPLVCRVFPSSTFHDNGWTFDEFKLFCEKIRELKSPFIIPYRKIFRDSHHIYAIRSYIAGDSIHSRADRGFISKTAQNILFAMWKVIVRTVCHLHQHDIFPVFLKPTNIFLIDNNSVLITDLYPVPRVNAGFAKDTLYMACLAPEVFSGGKVGTYTDVWALGVLLIYMMVGRMPWNMKNKFSVVRQINIREFEIFQIPDGIQRIIDHTVVVDPEKRAPCAKLLKVSPVSTTIKRPKIVGTSRTPVAVSDLAGLAQKLMVNNKKSMRLRRVSSCKTPPTFALM